MKRVVGLLSLILFAVLAASADSPVLAPVPALAPFHSDGCSLFPDRSPFGTEDWCHCCLAHDLAYWRGGTVEERLKADQDFKSCIQQAAHDDVLAELMFTGVRAGGGPYFTTPYRWGYGWTPARGYGPLTDAEKASALTLERAYRVTNPNLQCTFDLPE